MLKKLLPPTIYTKLSYVVTIQSIEEIRITIGIPIMVIIDGQKRLFDIAKKEDVEWILGVLTRESMYAMNDCLVKGFLSYDGGIRVGVCGEIVGNEVKISTIKNINGLVIRVPHEKKGIFDNIIDKIFEDNRVKSTLIIGPPLAGKTTYLREFSRVLSKEYLKKVVVIDEKNEITATINGKSHMDVGYSSVLVGIDRRRGVESSIRNLSPEVIVTDELYGEEDKNAIARCIKSGVSVIATMHGVNPSEKFVELFDCLIRLTDKPVGKILEMRELC